MTALAVTLDADRPARCRFRLAATLGSAAMGLGLAALPVAAFSAPITFDFAAYGEASEVDLGYEAVVPTLTLTREGLAAVVTSVGVGGVCLDSSWRLGDAPGIGAAPGDRCDASDEDGIKGFDEAIAIVFDEAVDVVWTLTESAPGWREAGGRDHTLLEGPVCLNGQRQDVTGGELRASGSRFVFSGDCAEGDFYVTAALAEPAGPPLAPVPLPAGAALLAGALAALGALARRRSR